MTSQQNLKGGSTQSLDKNLSILERIIPQLARDLRSFDEKNLTFCETRKGELNLRRLAVGKDAVFHSNYDAGKEAEKWFASLDLNGISVLFVYGVGLGYYYDAAKEWLGKDAENHLVFIEDDLGVLKKFLCTEKGTEILLDRQVQLHYFPSGAEGETMLHWVTTYFVSLQLEVSALDVYSRTRSDTYTQIKSFLMHESVVKNQQLAEYMRQGRTFFKNFYSNLSQLHKSYHGNQLFQKFKGVPAIICGAGPSLDKNFECLKGLKDKALIFGGGSSLNALSTRGFLPHFGAGIDPNPPQLQRLLTNYAFELPFFYRSRMFHQAFNTIEGPRLYMTGTGGYHCSDWFEERLGIDGEFIDEGHNVVNFSAEIARSLGCSPIIFVGMDLAYTDLKAYAGGVVDDSTVNEERITSMCDLETGAFQREDIDGKPVFTLWKWVAESQWISEFAQKYPVDVFNATEGGIGFEGVPNLSLKEISEKFLGKTYDLDSMVHTEIQNASMPHVTKEKTTGLMLDLQKSLKAAEGLCDRMLEEIESCKKKIDRGPGILRELEQGLGAEVEQALVKEEAFHAILAVFNEAYSKVLNRELHQVRHDRSLKTEKERGLKRLEINQKKFDFLKSCSLINQMIIDEVLKERR
jgi:hypothetical protein